jgi:hypothetical protein
MARAFQKLTRPAMRKLASGAKIMEHGITFERLASGDGVFRRFPENIIPSCVDGHDVGAVR